MEDFELQTFFPQCLLINSTITLVLPTSFDMRILLKHQCLDLPLLQDACHSPAQAAPALRRQPCCPGPGPQVPSFCSWISSLCESYKVVHTPVVTILLNSLILSGLQILIKCCVCFFSLTMASSYNLWKAHLPQANSMESSPVQTNKNFQFRIPIFKR